MWSGFSILLGDPKKLAIFNIRWYATSRPSFLEQSLASNVLEYTWGKKMSLPRYFSLIHFWLRSNFVNHKPVSYGTSSHHTQCSNKALSFEAATKARSSSDPCWVLGTVGSFLCKPGWHDEECLLWPWSPRLQTKELIFSPALQSV